MNNTQRISEFPAYSTRMSSRWEAPECGHGTCAATVDCTGSCKLKSAVIGLPVIDSMTPDSLLLHRVDASQLARGDKARFMNGTNTCDVPIEMLDPIPSVVRSAGHLKTAALVVLLGLVFGAVLLSSIK